MIYHERAFEVFENAACLFEIFAVIVGHSRIESLSAANRLRKRAHRLFERSLGIEAVVIENINIFKPHAFEALIKTREKIFAASVPASVGSRPHLIARLRADYHFIAVCPHLVGKNFAEILFRAARRRAVIICQVEMRDAVVECGKAEFFHV